MNKCAFDIGCDTCFALTEKSCIGCRFYKTTRQLNQGRAKAHKRLEEISGGFMLQERYHRDFIECEVL